jgi:GTPase Era involved in 16S rRNA processing
MLAIGYITSTITECIFDYLIAVHLSVKLPQNIMILGTKADKLKRTDIRIVMDLIVKLIRKMEVDVDVQVKAIWKRNVLELGPLAL